MERPETPSGRACIPDAPRSGEPDVSQSRGVWLTAAWAQNNDPVGVPVTVSSHLEDLVDQTMQPRIFQFFQGSLWLTDALRDTVSKATNHQVSGVFAPSFPSGSDA